MYYILIEDINTIKLDIDVKLGGWRCLEPTKSSIRKFWEDLHGEVRSHW
jgi:hypothetical protein